MERASDPLPAKNEDFVVPLPRVTDALGRTLRRAFRPCDEGAFGDLLRRLDAIA